ncbi:hypothetical protein F2Q69_00023192 [Brassica cretica]|uniref:Uncharacterized protein n=1 Tax=Brassica cretica TaxID=69181 RepID=A0A8S9QM39_BRACR|nr:hypothetical protein F2Q69_00023192 [Brassica cretica]
MEIISAEVNLSCFPFKCRQRGELFVLRPPELPERMGYEHVPPQVPPQAVPPIDQDALKQMVQDAARQAAHEAVQQIAQEVAMQDSEEAPRIAAQEVARQMAAAQQQILCGPQIQV